jgi:hypothetical protein
MTLRRATILVHGLVVAMFVAGAAFLVWVTATYTPDPDDDFSFGPGFVAIPIAVGLLVVAGVVAWLVRLWMHTGKRGVLALADVVAALSLLVVPVLLPPPLLLTALATVVLAGGFVAASKPMLTTDGQASLARKSPRRVVVVLAVVAAAVLIGFLLVGPMLLMGTFWVDL